MIYTGCVYAHILRAENSAQNGWMYIGQAEDVQKRWAQKESAYRKCKFIYRELCKYGWDSFEHIVLEDNISNEDLNDREIYWINKYHTCVYDKEYKAGFNLTFGGEGVRGPKPSMQGKIPKNISMLTEMKYKPVKCWTNGIWKNKKYFAGQTWDSVESCARYFGVSHNMIHVRIYSKWLISSGPIVSFIDDVIENADNYISNNIQKTKDRQTNAGKELVKHRRNAYENSYNILCIETGQVFNRVVDCMKEFDMARSTLNGHINYPEKHPTAKGYHFKRIPKTNTDG